MPRSLERQHAKEQVANGRRSIGDLSGDDFGDDWSEAAFAKVRESFHRPILHPRKAPAIERTQRWQR
jgi:hypothetical protein